MQQPWEHPDWYDLHDTTWTAGPEREPEHYRELVLALPPLDRDDHLIDAGAGTGKLACMIARSYPRLALPDRHFGSVEERTARRPASRVTATSVCCVGPPARALRMTRSRNRYTHSMSANPARPISPASSIRDRRRTGSFVPPVAQGAFSVSRSYRDPPGASMARRSLSEVRSQRRPSASDPPLNSMMGNTTLPTVTTVPMCRGSFLPSPNPSRRA